MPRLRWALVTGTALAMSCVAFPMGLQAHDHPPNSARPGECFGRADAPPVYGTEQHQVLVRRAWTETRHTPAVIDRIARQVLVRPEVVERHRTPATYRTVVDWVERPGPTRRVYEPARYDTVQERVEVAPGHAEWRRQSAPLAYGETQGGQTLVQGTGEIMCRVWVPARYETVERRVQVSSARSYDEAGPSRQEKIVRRELVSPGGWVEHRRPAVYRTEYVNRVFRAARADVVQHPAVYRTVETRTLVRPGRKGWSRIACIHPAGVSHAPPPQVALAPPPPPPPARDCSVCALSVGPSAAYIARIQRALIAQGYDPGLPDGEARPQTYAAVRQFQNQHGLPQAGLSLDTAAALGVQ